MRTIYIASKTKHAQRWRDRRDMGDHIISTWIDEAGAGESGDLNDLWRRCIDEASTCEILIAYREPDEVFKGGWVEMGAALAMRVPVYAVGFQGFTISEFSGLTHFDNIDAAFFAAKTAANV